MPTLGKRGRYLSRRGLVKAIMRKRRTFLQKHASRAQRIAAAVVPYKLYKKPLFELAQPATRTVKLKYSDTVEIDPGAGGAASHYFFSCNSIFDPDRSSTGHQPFGFDHYASVYNHYTVLSSVCTVTFTRMQNETQPTAGALMIQDDTSNSNVNMRTIKEVPSASAVILPGLGTSAGTHTKGSVSKTWSRKINLRVKDAGDPTDAWSAVVNTNPVDEQYFDLMYGPIAGSANLNAVAANVTIEYFVIFREPKDYVED